MKDRLITLAEAVEILDCSYSKGQKLMKAGVLPGKKIGRTWRIPLLALYEYLGLVPQVEGGNDE